MNTPFIKERLLKLWLYDGEVRTTGMAYSWSALKTGIRSPRLAIDEIEKIYYSKEGGDQGINILSEDWDVLAILDACRYDSFAKRANIQGELKKVRSKASATDPFLRKNLSGKDATDAVYVTGNPQFYRIQNGIYDVDPIDCEFYDTINVWQDNWDEEHRTVRPEIVTDAAIRAAENYPNKRILVHYLQPHAPYIGPTGQEHLPTDVLNFWTSYKKGEIEVDLEVVRQAYHENLDLVLEDVKRLFTEIEGKIVVSADHGEMLGERSGLLPTRKYGHPIGVHTPGLVEVPWLVKNTGERRDIVAEEPEQTGDLDVADEEVKERLRDLGYAE